MPVITKDVTLLHRLSKSADSVEVRLPAGEQVRILKEWAGHYLIRTTDGKVFNVKKEFVDPSG